MKKGLKIILSFVGIIAGYTLTAQVTTSFIEGNISYISSQNIYVKFSSTEGLKPGDTLFIHKEKLKKPALIIQQLSSISCVTKPIFNDVFKPGDNVFAVLKKGNKIQNEIAEKKLDLLPVSNEVIVQDVIIDDEKRGEFKQDISGKLKLAANSNFSNNFNNDNQRFRYTFSLNARHLDNSGLSLESYVAFSHRSYDGVAVPIEFSDLKIYTLAARYDFSKKTRLWIGRKINNKIANVGAIDGIQAETQVNNFTFGAAVGARPNYLDYSFDFSLFEFGFYAAHQYNGKSGLMENTFSIFEQKNSGKTDRRFMYFQHSNSLAKNVNAFVSFEMDMYKLINGTPTNDLSLTSMFTSLSYRFSQRFNLTASYDARKNVVYYETFQALADSILESSTRQGYRLRMNYRPVNKLSIGASASYRNRPEDSRPSKNANIYVRYAQLPFLDASIGVTANLLQTAYLDGQIYGVQLDKDLFSGKLGMGLNLRHVKYDFVNSSIPLNQNIAEINLNWQIAKKLNFSTSYEGVFESDNQYNRIYISLQKRF